MLELLLAAFIQLNSAFGAAPVSTSNEYGGNSWGDTHIEACPGDTTSYSDGGNGWGDTH